MSSKIIFKENFNKDYGILDSTINHMHGVMQAEASLEDDDALNEYFFQVPLKRALKRKTHQVLPNAIVIDNKAFSLFSNSLSKYSKRELNPQFDVHIKTQGNTLLAAFELKSVFGSGTTKQAVYNDIARLAITKALFPDTSCAFVIVGKKRELIDFYKKSDFLFSENLSSKKKISRKWVSIEPEDLSPLDENLREVIKDLKISNIEIKLSRTQSTSRYHCMSYLIKVLKMGERHKQDFSSITWDEVNEGDIIFEGGIEPQKNIGLYRLVDQIDLKSCRVMYQTNDVDDQDWTEFYRDAQVWRFEPKGRL